MLRYLSARLALFVPTLFAVSVIVFLISQVLPGDVGRTILGPYASAAQVAHLDRMLGYDQSIPIRYGHWVSGFLSGAWGTSPVLQQPILPLVGERLLNSALLAAVAFVMVVPISVAAGVLAGLREGSRLDQVISLGGLTLLGIPEFVGGTLLLVVLAVELKVLPVTAQAPAGFGLVGRIHYLILPAIPLMFVLFGYIARMARAGTVDVVQTPYVRTATLKGLPRHVVVRSHILRNSMLPTVTVIGAQVGYLVGGLVVVEKLFNYPGIGNLLLTAANGHDVPVLEDVAVVLGGIYMVAILLTDLSYAALNPRIRYS